MVEPLPNMSRRKERVGGGEKEEKEFLKCTNCVMSKSKIN